MQNQNHQEEFSHKIRIAALARNEEQLLLLLENITDPHAARRVAFSVLQDCPPDFAIKMNQILGFIPGDDERACAAKPAHPLDVWETFKSTIIHRTWRGVADPAAQPSAAGPVPWDAGESCTAAQVWVADAEARRRERRRLDALGTGWAVTRLWNDTSVAGKEETARSSALRFPPLTRGSSVRGSTMAMAVGAAAAEMAEVERTTRAREAAEALREGRTYLRERGSPRGALASFRRALPLATAAGDGDARAEALLLAGDMLRALGRFREARDLHREHAALVQLGSAADSGPDPSPWADAPRTPASEDRGCGRAEWGREGRDYWVARARSGPVSRVDWTAGAGRVRMEDVRDAAAAARAGRAGELPALYRPAARWGEG